MPTVPTYEALASDIKNLGTRCVFGLMSDDTAMLVTTLDAMGVKFHAARHENNAIAMAEGYAAATGGLSIAILGRGPATANAIHGATYALRSGSRVLLIFGYPSIAAASTDGVAPDTKAFNSAGVLRAAGLRTFVATDSLTARRMLAQAAAATRQGAMALLLPMNELRRGTACRRAADPRARSPRWADSARLQNRKLGRIRPSATGWT